MRISLLRYSLRMKEPVVAVVVAMVAVVAAAVAEVVEVEEYYLHN
jgi:hypothetical protein